MAIAIMLHPAALVAHDSGLVYARLERNAARGTLTLQASVECLSNPLVAGQDAARDTLVTMFDLQGVAGRQDDADHATGDATLGKPQWSTQSAWTDHSVPVPVVSPEGDTEEHCWVTACWVLNLPHDEAVCLHVNPATKLAALLWEIDPSRPIPEGKARWQILLPGDRSYCLNVPDTRITSAQAVPDIAAAKLAWVRPVAGIGAFAVVVLAAGLVVPRWRARLLRRPLVTGLPQ